MLLARRMEAARAHQLGRWRGYQDQSRLPHRPPRHRGRGPGESLRQRYRRARRHAAVLPGLFRDRKTGSRRGRAGGGGPRARLPPQRLRADRRRDRRDARPLCARRIRPGGLHRGRSRAARAADGQAHPTGRHPNVYSRARKLLFEVAGYAPTTVVPELAGTVADALLQVHRSYLKPIRALVDQGLLRGAAHITGDGLTDNTPRMLPEGLAPQIDPGAWTIPPIFELLRRLGSLPEDDYRRTFNLGIGMILAVPRAHARRAEEMLRKLGEPYLVAGQVVLQKRRGPRVVYR